jgi:putative transport protein
VKEFLEGIKEVSPHAEPILVISITAILGLRIGSITDPPALAFSTKLTNSDYPSLAYANVYPLTMLMRILVAQIAVLWLC